MADEQDKGRVVDGVRVYWPLTEVDHLPTRREIRAAEQELAGWELAEEIEAYLMRGQT